MKTMTARMILALSAIALMSLCACGDQSVDPGTPVAGDAGPQLEVNYLAQSVPVDLSTLSTIDYKSAKLVKLSDVWTASKISTDPTTLEYELVGSDGFKPSSKTGCVDLPGTMLDKGYISPVTRNVVWDESLGLAGCYGVKDTATLNAHAPTDAGSPALDGSADAPAE
jgi:hypothetical protein